MSSCKNLKLQCLLCRKEPADPSLASNGSGLIYHVECNSLGINLGKSVEWDAKSRAGEKEAY